MRLISAVTDTAVSNLSHKVWQMRHVQQKRANFMDSLIEKKQPVDTEHVADAYVPKVRVLTPIERAVQAFLASSKLDGYAEPFLELDLVKECPKPERVAQIINQVMCIIRYLCKGDPIFCEGALAAMLNELGNCGENVDDFTISLALSAGACAMGADTFKQHFIEQPHEQWKHAYIIEADPEIAFDDFMGMLQSMFATLQYTCPDFSRLIQHKDHLGDWVEDINTILEPMELKLVQLESEFKNCYFVLLKSFECNVLNGMMAEIADK